MRLFLGIELPDDIKTYLHQSIIPCQYGQKGWEHPYDYHLTLLFIGEATISECEMIMTRLQDIRTTSFYLTLGELRFFNRRILYVNFVESLELIQLKQLVNQSFPEWAVLEKKPFLPHVTLKRWQRHEYADLAAGILNIELRPKQFLVKEICLFESKSDNLNRKYHVRGRKVFNL